MLGTSYGAYQSPIGVFGGDHRPDKHPNGGGGGAGRLKREIGDLMVEIVHIFLYRENILTFFVFWSKKLKIKF